jgi:hypothetical protein
LSIFHQSDPAAMALKEKALTQEEICKLAMDIALANAEEAKNLPFGAGSKICCAISGAGRRGVDNGAV